MLLGEDDRLVDVSGSGGACGSVDAGGRGDVLLAEWRVWAVQQWENECLIDDGAVGSLDDASGHIEAVGAALAGVEVGGVDGEVLMGTCLALEGLQRRLGSLKATVVGRMDALGVTEAAAGLGVKRWVANRTHGSTAAVGRELKMARTLKRFGSFAEAFAEGQISADHVLALAAVCNDRITDALVDLEDALVRFAKVHRFQVFVAHLRQVAAMLDVDGAQPDCGDRDTAAVGKDLEGHLHVSLELSGHNAVEIEGIINDETDRQYRAAVREQEAAGIAVPAMGVLRARAVVELIRRGANPNPTGSKPVASVTLTLRANRDGQPAGVVTLDGCDIDAVTAAVLFCDAHFQPVVVDGSGNPINLGRTVRLYTPAQKRALVTRDGGCIFPGCDQPARRCAAHHEIEWDNGGFTDVDNGSLLCPRHHGLVHGHNPWTIERCHIDDLPADLLEAHLARAASANLDPATQVRVFRSPDGRLLLAQNATDHHGPAPNTGPVPTPGPAPRAGPAPP